MALAVCSVTSFEKKDMTVKTLPLYMAKTKILYSCSECGGQTLKWQGQCPHCSAWNTLVETIAEKARRTGLSEKIIASRYDVRQPLPFEDGSLDACFSHMLYCMALTTDELGFLSREIRRVLKTGRLNIYTVRHTGDPHYGKGIHRGEEMYEISGFIVHFFSREKVERLAEGYEIVGIEEFEEGEVRKRLFLVTLRKP